MLMRVTDTTDAKIGNLPEIIFVNLGYCDRELIAYSYDNRLDDLAFFLERMAFWQM
jgi:hypothetical protein